MARSKQLPAALSAEQKLLADERAFRRKRTHLMKRYPGEFVVVHQGRVVAHGHDDESLAGRMFEKLGDEPFYIGHVDDEMIYELPSPEVVRGG